MAKKLVRGRGITCNKEYIIIKDLYKNIWKEKFKIELTVLYKLKNNYVAINCSYFFIY